jgi:hypothetical protein
MNWLRKALGFLCAYPLLILTASSFFVTFFFNLFVVIHDGNFDKAEIARLVKSADALESVLLMALTIAFRKKKK